MIKIDKRQSNRTVIEESVKIRKLNEEDKIFINTNIDLKNISLNGLGFTTTSKLKIGYYYEAEIKLHRNDMINVIIKIVWSKDKGHNIKEYGAAFIGLTNIERVKISVYNIFSTRGGTNKNEVC